MTETAPRQTRRCQQLAVEDEVGLVDRYTAWLTDTYEVRTAYNGEEDLHKLDVVFLDRRTPEMSGDEVLDEIRERGFDCRMVIVSAVTPDFDVIGLKFDGYLIKPVEEEKLRNSVDQTLMRVEYDETIQEFYQLAVTKATLEARYSESELQSNDEYADLQDRIAELQAGADAPFSELAKDDLEAMFRDLGLDATDRHSSDHQSDRASNARNSG